MPIKGVLLVIGLDVSQGANVVAPCSTEFDLTTSGLATLLFVICPGVIAVSRESLRFSSPMFDNLCSSESVTCNADGDDNWWVEQ